MADSKDGAQPAREGDLRAPDDWEKTFFPASELGQPARDAWKHAAASALHGWAAHAYHQGEPLKLSKEDYEAALQAATTLKEQDGRPTYLPHPAALSPHLPQAARPQPEAARQEAEGAAPPPFEAEGAAERLLSRRKGS
jgi:hypothetical protein